jgi:hypothetical protein
MQRPDAYPEYATQDANNGVLGGANVQEPSAYRKAFGWIWGEKPPYNIFNWLQRYNYLWIKYRESRSNEVDSFFTSQW